MKRFDLQEPLQIQQLHLDNGSIPLHAHNHYELILIKAGTGCHVINENRWTYRAGDLFFLSPSDHHSLSMQQQTSFYNLSFTAIYLAGLVASSAYTWSYIQNHHSTVFGNIVADQSGPAKLMTLVEIALSEQQERQEILSNLVVDSLMKTILSLVDRQLAQQSLATTRPTTSSALIHRVVAYVCQHITEPDSLRMDTLADVFNYSPSHLGTMFKQHIGESIQQYIIRYKLKRVETRLSVSSLTISQIADEFGFADVCHLNKLFKRYYHDTPTNYRRYRLSS